MTHQEIREKFRKFMEAKGHLWVASSSLLPGDPSVLFTTAGMQQFKPYYTAPEVAPAKNVASIQKCVRTSDIDEVGDESHLTFFEMLGNFSFGGYFKEEAIRYAYEFITSPEWMRLKIDYVSVFGGEGDIPADDESEKIWKSLDAGITVKKAGKADNFWGPTGNDGPCGPTTEIYVDGVEIWNIVFNQYYQRPDKTLEPLETPGVDTGMGLERLAMVAQKVQTVFEADLFQKPLGMLLNFTADQRKARIIADHLRGALFLLSDGVRPSNKEQGYVLRRLIRRLLVHAEQEYIPLNRMKEFIWDVIMEYGPFYPNLMEGEKEIISAFEKESQLFQQTLERGLKELYRKYPGLQAQKLEPGREIRPFIVGQKIKGEDAFDLYQSYGFPKEIIKELAEERLYEFDEEAFNRELEKHQERSRTASAGMFKGGLAGNSEVITRYHTATHLLNAALRKVLGAHVIQKGSNITEERTRFDFSHPAKMTNKEKTEVEQLVNEWIARDLPVERKEMPLREARELGAVGAFGEKYHDTVSVYTVSDPKTGEVISREFCGGPHVTHTGEIGTFKIIKEEAVSAGVRRIKATIL